MRAADWHEGFFEYSQLATEAQQAALEECAGAGRNRVQLTSKVDICRRFWITFDQFIRDSQLIHKGDQFFASLRAVRAAFDQETIYSLALNDAAHAIGPFDQCHVDAECLQTIGAKQARYACADDYDLSVICPRHSMTRFSTRTNPFIVPT